MMSKKVCADVNLLIINVYLDLLDKLRGSASEFRSRSALVRAAIREYAAQVHKRLEEEREREVVHKSWTSS